MPQQALDGMYVRAGFQLMCGKGVAQCVNAAILGGQGSEHTLRVLRRQIDDLQDPLVARTMAVGLALGSPDFQKQ